MLEAMLDFLVLELFATDGQTDGRTKATFIAPFPTVGSIISKSTKVRHVL